MATPAIEPGNPDTVDHNVTTDPTALPKIVITSGEPAGIGPDLVLTAAMSSWDAQLVVLGNQTLLAERARLMGLSVIFEPYSSTPAAEPHTPGTLPLIDLPLRNPCEPGVLEPGNASYVMAQLDMAVELCRAKECQAIVTAPVNKAVINRAGIPFSGHTEFLAAATGTDRVVMMLVADTLRIALATTHIQLRDVPDAMDAPSLLEMLKIIHTHLRTHCCIDQPQITVLGLNPHAGESGHLGFEEETIIAPACEAAREQGMSLRGPLPADSAFIPSMREQTDAYLAMYHDQGLPVLKALGFHKAVNVTLGLPIVRTSVDHGTALDLAGTGKADSGSLETAIRTAITLATAAG